MSKKGLSKDQKQKVILSIYHEMKEPFNLKEIEKAASNKGVVLQTVKDMNQELLHDNLVLMDKIGSANIFWSFPSKVFMDKKNEKANLEAAGKKRKVEMAGLEELRETEQKLRKSTGRDSKLQRLDQLKEIEAEYSQILEKNKITDPAEVKKVVDAANKCKDGANRWTDNVFTLKTYLVKKKGMSSKEADKLLKIDTAFDYLESAPSAKGSVKKK